MPEAILTTGIQDISNLSDTDNTLSVHAKVDVLQRDLAALSEEQHQLVCYVKQTLQSLTTNSEYGNNCMYGQDQA